MRPRHEHVEQHISTKDMAGWWKMDTDSRPAWQFDYSFNNHDGRMVGTNIKLSYPGVWFNGTDDRITTLYDYEPVFQSAFSIFLWSKPDDGHPDAEMDVLFGSKDTTGVVFQLKDLSGQIQVVYTSEAVSVVCLSTGTVFRNGVSKYWAHLAYTISQTNGARLYINGVLDQTEPIGAAVMANYACTARAMIGARSTGADPNEDHTNHITGKMGDVILYSAEKTAEEVRSVFEIQRRKYNV